MSGATTPRKCCSAVDPATTTRLGARSAHIGMVFGPMSPGGALVPPSLGGIVGSGSPPSVSHRPRRWQSSKPTHIELVQAVASCW